MELWVLLLLLICRLRVVDVQIDLVFIYLLKLVVSIIVDHVLLLLELPLHFMLDSLCISFGVGDIGRDLIDVLAVMVVGLHINPGLFE